MNTTDVTVTAGLGGFFVLFGLGLTVWLLMRDMSRRMRNVRNDHTRGTASGRPPSAPGGAEPAAAPGAARADQRAADEVARSGPDREGSAPGA